MRTRRSTNQQCHRRFNDTLEIHDLYATSSAGVPFWLRSTSTPNEDSEAMLQLRPNCECCNRDLPNESQDARICSFECTFCASCAEERLGNVCPNCGGEL